MQDYTHEKCPVCDKDFFPEDDIVVCPECGTPYHRNCYNTTNECVNKHLHESGYSWEGSANNEQDNISACKICGANNPEGSLFCNRCGAFLSDDNDMPNNQFGNQPTIEMFFDPMGGVSPDEELSDGVKAKDVSKYVGANSPYYLSTFKRIKTGRFGRFNFCAFWFTGGWFLYRKQYKIGAIISLLVFALIMSSLFISINFGEQINQIYQGAISAVGTNSYSMYFTTQQRAAMDEYVKSLTSQQMLLIITPFLLQIANWAIMIFCGIMGNKMYMKHVVKKIKKLKQESDLQAVYEEKLSQHGGVNISIALCMAFCYMIVRLLPNIL